MIYFILWTNFPLKIIHISFLKNVTTNCYSVFSIDFFERMVNLRLSFLEVFNSKTSIF